MTWKGLGWCTCHAELGGPKRIHSRDDMKTEVVRQTVLHLGSKWPYKDKPGKRKRLAQGFQIARTSKHGVLL
jgi:hypothetical protein